MLEWGGGDWPETQRLRAGGVGGSSAPVPGSSPEPRGPGTGWQDCRTWGVWETGSQSDFTPSVRPGREPDVGSRSVSFSCPCTQVPVLGDLPV